jgi:hypothetical protein
VRSALRRWLPPLVCVALAVVAGALGIHGSSLGVYADGYPQREVDGLLVGEPRPIRSDEWLVRTPWVIAKAERGFPDELPGGVGTHDLSLTDVPGRPWEVLVRPTHVPYYVTRIDIAFALEWWATFSVAFCGVYALVTRLTRRPAVAAGTALLVVLSPALQWWTNPTPFTTVGYGTGAVALLITAAAATSSRRRIFASVAAGWATAAFAATLYPPWQVGVAITVLPLAAIALVDCWRAQPTSGDAIRRLAQVTLPAAVVFAALFGSFVYANSTTIAAVADTVYPGGRTSESGGGVPLVHIFGAPFDYAAERDTTTVVNGTNQSENATGLALVFPVSVAAYGLAAAGQLRLRQALPLLCVLGSSALLLAWMLLPVPDAFASVTPLGRVQPPRLLLPLALASALAAGLACSTIGDGRPVRPLIRWTSVGVFAAASLWAADTYRVEGVALVMTHAALVAVPVIAGVALLLGRRPALGLALLTAFTAVQAANINPLQRGLDPILDNPVARAVRAVSDGDDAGWAVFEHGDVVKGTLIASGVDVVSGVAFYPDRSAWDLLDPDGAFEDHWNRYARVTFTVGGRGTPPVMEAPFADALIVRLDPCGDELRDLGVRYVVSASAVAEQCAVGSTTVTYQGAPVTIERLPSGA